MARIDNAITFGSGFNISSTGPIDSRMRVEYESDLIDAATWPSDKAPLFDGMSVVVMETAEIWVLKDKTKFTDKTTGQGWVKSGGRYTPTPPEPLCFTAQEANSTIGLVKLSTNQTLEYSTDLTTWSAMTTATTITLANSGDSCYVRGILRANNTESNYTRFKMTGKIAASGNCNYLWDYENLDAPLKEYCGYQTFYDCNSLTTAPELPATTLANWCYSYMFYNCTSLTTVPGLPATTLADRCYSSMFYHCTSLATTPELPATTLAICCYQYMFNGCTSLTIAPELPATTLANYCYFGMFQYCANLTTVPLLPASVLTTSCYNTMFMDCTNLNYIKCLATNISADYCTINWVIGVQTNSGTFVKESTMTGWTLDSNSGIPSGWTVYNHYTDVELDKKLDTKQDKDIPEPLCFTAQQANSTIGLKYLSTNQTLEYSTDLTTWSTMTTATTITLVNSGESVYIRGVLIADNTNVNYTQFKMTGAISASGNCNYLWNYENLDASLKQYCGYYMFAYCSSLTTAPELPATTLASYCYNGMFAYCSGLTTAHVLPSTTLASYCYSNMFNDCTSLTNAPELPATTLANNCYGGMFYGCTSLTTTPELPATTLAERCYYYMFYGCTSLTTAPELPATTLANSCYASMFSDCTNLNYIKCLATNISATGCTSNWVSGVTSAGTFVKESTATGWTLDNINGIPSGWTVYDHYSDVELDKELDTKVESTTINTIWRGTQTEYDALQTYDNNTLYVIVEQQ